MTDTDPPPALAEMKTMQVWDNPLLPAGAEADPTDDLLDYFVVSSAVLCDMGPHEGQYKVKLQGYITTEQLNQLRAR